MLLDPRVLTMQAQDVFYRTFPGDWRDNLARLISPSFFRRACSKRHTCLNPAKGNHQLNCHAYQCKTCITDITDSCF